MSDDADVAGDRIEKELEAARAAASQRAAIEAATPMPVYCSNGCGEKARELSRWCSAECRDEADLRQRQLKRSGRL